MCLAVYIGSDHPLPLVSFHKDKPDFHVIALTDKEKSVRSHFASPHVRYAGTEEGCGCAFNYGYEYPDFEMEPEEVEAGKRSRTKLVDYLKMNDVHEVYSCWEGEEPHPKESTRTIVPDQILEADFVFKVYELIHVSRTQQQQSHVVYRT